MANCYAFRVKRADFFGWLNKQGGLRYRLIQIAAQHLSDAMWKITQTYENIASRDILFVGGCEANHEPELIDR